MPKSSKKNPDIQEKNRNPDGTFPKGVSGNPNGRPKGTTLKEYQAQKFREMLDHEKEQWLIDNKVSGETIWKMAEGNPTNNTDITSGGEPLKSVDPTDPVILESLKAIQEKLENE